MKSRFSILITLILLCVSPILIRAYSSQSDSDRSIDLDDLQARLSQYQTNRNFSSKLNDYESVRLDLMGKKIEVHHMKLDKQLSMIRNQKKYLQARLSPILGNNEASNSI